MKRMWAKEQMPEGGKLYVHSVTLTDISECSYSAKFISTKKDKFSDVAELGSAIFLNGTAEGGVVYMVSYSPNAPSPILYYDDVATSMGAATVTEFNDEEVIEWS